MTSIKPARYQNAAERAEKDAAEKALLAETARLLAEQIEAAVPRRVAAAKADIREGLDAIALAVDNLRGAVEAAHAFDVRALVDRMRFALSELDAAEKRVVAESGLVVV